MKKAILIMALLTAVTTAQAQDNRWTHIVTTNTAANYVDLTQVSIYPVTGGVLKTVWWRMRRFDGYSIDAYTQFNCSSVTPAFYVHQESTYWDRTNALIGQSNTTDGKWRYAGPDTAGEALWRAVCR